MKERIALFDFDGTITRSDSFVAFARFSVGAFNLGAAMIRTMPWLLLWKLGLYDNSKAKERLFGALYKGKSREWFDYKCSQFKLQIDEDLRPEGMERLKRHIGNHDRVYIVSASIAGWISPWAKENGIDGVIATEVEVDGKGLLTGRFSTPNCYGVEKVNRIKEYLGDLDRYEIWAYSDSRADTPLMSIATHPEIF